MFAVNAFGNISTIAHTYTPIHTKKLLIIINWQLCIRASEGGVDHDSLQLSQLLLTLLLRNCCFFSFLQQIFALKLQNKNHFLRHHTPYYSLFTSSSSLYIHSWKEKNNKIRKTLSFHQIIYDFKWIFCNRWFQTHVYSMNKTRYYIFSFVNLLCTMMQKHI